MTDGEASMTGERLDADDALFGVDLLRHRAAYREAIRVAQARSARRLLELGSGTGYGARELAEALPFVVALDRVAPSTKARASGAHFLRGDLSAVPLAGRRFDLVVSFQVVEHLADPRPYLRVIAQALEPDGVALVSTPNRLESDGENPFHVHEYEAEELRALLEQRFEQVELLGLSVRGEALRFHRERLRRIQRIVRLDPLALRRRLPRPLVEWLFARFARLVRRGIANHDAIPYAAPDEFFFEPAHAASLDLFAVCRRPRTCGLRNRPHRS